MMPDLPFLWLSQNPFKVVFVVHGFVARCKILPSLFFFGVYVISIGTKIRKRLKFALASFETILSKMCILVKNMMVVKIAIHIVRSYEFTMSFIFSDLRLRENCDFGGSRRIGVVNRLKTAIFAMRCSRGTPHSGGGRAGVPCGRVSRRCLAGAPLAAASCAVTPSARSGVSCGGTSRCRTSCTSRCRNHCVTIRVFF